ncbi:MAG: 23S rRNA (pseudouridine(1915)-N(3))-methyltransferase RlmH [Burkholderiales bacterium]
MRFLVVAVSHRQPEWVESAFADYTKRMPRDARIERVVLKPEPRPENAGPTAIDRLLAREAERILAAVPPRAHRIALDERGRAVTTRDLARSIESWQAIGGDVAFLIGSADGLDATLKSGAQERLALSALTLPHGLVQVLLAEQLFRALSLIRGHPYHRE